MRELRDFTIARVGLGRAGNSIPTRALLDFQLAHARARDAVHYPLNAGGWLKEIEAEGWQGVAARSAVRDRAEYLRRPDLGRRLDAESKARLEALHGAFDVALIVSDGLSALAVERHAMGVLRGVMAGKAWSVERGGGGAGAGGGGR
jgi:ethanolamine ammonia-lyase small subunit